MSELSARVAIKTLIEANTASLLLDLAKQGQDRELRQITYSGITPPKEFYFLNVFAEEVETFDRVDSVNTSTPRSETEYSMVVEVSDYAMAQSGENEIYEKLDADFQIFTTRLRELIRLNYRLTQDGIKFRLVDQRRVRQQNFSDFDDSSYYALLYARLTFTLLEEC